MKRFLLQLILSVCVVLHNVECQPFLSSAILWQLGYAAAGNKHAHQGGVQATYVPTVHIHPDIKKTVSDLGFAPDLLSKSYCYFSQTSGFDHLIEVVNSTYAQGLYTFLKGYVYELEVAVALHENGYTIHSFHCVLFHPHNSSKREIDIVANNCCIECKNIYWPATLQEPYAKQLKQQIMHQHIIIDACNAHYKTENCHLVVSKKPIPPVWSSWFSKHAISCASGVPVTCYSNHHQNSL